MTEQDDMPTPYQYDEWLTTKVIFPIGDGYQQAVITYHKWDLEGNIIVQKNENQMLGTRVYIAEFPDGESIKIAGKFSVEFILQSCDAYGNKFMLLKEIMDHKSIDKAVNNSEGCITCKNWAPERRNTKKLVISHQLVWWYDFMGTP